MLNNKPSSDRNTKHTQESDSWHLTQQPQRRYTVSAIVTTPTIRNVRRQEETQNFSGVEGSTSIDPLA